MTTQTDHPAKPLLLVLAVLPLGAYEAYAVRTRRVPTITTAVRGAPRWLRAPLGAGLALAFIHLFLGRP